MSDDPKKHEPLDDLKEGLGLLYRAAKGAVEQLPTEKVEVVAKDAVKEVGRALETIHGELDKAFKQVAENVSSVKAGSQPPAAAPPPPPADGAAAAEAKKDEPAQQGQQAQQQWDDAYAPEPPKGPRVG
jgi:hypothetical protein